jgi:pantoate--beta-alanine ligase
MNIITTINEMRVALAQERARGKKISFVPTMGNLHDGHLTLMQRAHQLGDCVVASIFVNQMQFGPSEDYTSYPRTPEEDQKKLRAEGVDYCFMPTAAEMYPPTGISTHTEIFVPDISTILCGATRPGHFKWVATVVAKLFNIVQPDVAVFGEKDFQQLTVIRSMAADLCMPVEIVGVPTARADDGLALSSRNTYLTEKERVIAPSLYNILVDTKQQLINGSRRFSELENKGKQALSSAGFLPDYFSILCQNDLGAPAPEDKALVILAAAKLGKARLIDNLQVTL